MLNQIDNKLKLNLKIQYRLNLMVKFFNYSKG
jgi:hypothetical protein